MAIEDNLGWRYRALISDTLPEELPLTFSNDALYRVFADEGKPRIRIRTFLTELFALCGSATRAFHYDANVGGGRTRRFSLVHPASQKRWAELVGSYSGLIIERCSISPLSLRAPFATVPPYMEKATPPRQRAAERPQLRGGPVLASDANPRPTTFFRYRGLKRMHKLFVSERFARLERRFRYLTVLDIQSCFSSIYTHSIAWALVGKEDAKSALNYHEGGLGADFDREMRNANWGETSGIVVGPEVSRVFAEIILQRVDLDILNAASSECGLAHGERFEVLRYIDNYYVFTSSVDDGEAIAGIVARCLSVYNLNLNPSKYERLERPFGNGVTTSILSAGILLSKLDNELVLTKAGAEHAIHPPDPNDAHSATGPTAAMTRRHRAWKQRSLRFMALARGIATGGNRMYSSTWNYLFSGICRRFDEVLGWKEPADKVGQVNALLELLSLMFNFFSLNPTSANSCRLAAACITLLDSEWLRKSGGEYQYEVQRLIRDECIQFLHDNKPKSPPNVSVEALNVLLIAGRLPKPYLLSDELLESIFGFDGNGRMLTPFEFGCLLNYCAEHAELATTKARVSTMASAHLKTVWNKEPGATLASSERLHLTLTFLGCRFISHAEREDVYHAMRNGISTLKGFSSQNNWLPATGPDVVVLLSSFTDLPPFCDWGKIRLDSVLRRLRLRFRY